MKAKFARRLSGAWNHYSFPRQPAGSRAPRFAMKPLALALGAALGIPAASFGDQIVTDGRTHTTLNVNGRVTDVTTATVVGNNAFNSFSKFDVYSGNTVNLQVPSGAANLLNLVNSSSASRIDGLLNAVKNGQIGGNVFLANPEGIVVGKSGVINAGSLTLLTPTHSFLDSFFDAPGAPNAGATTSMLTGTLPINDKGLIHVKGRINTTGDLSLIGGDIINAGSIQTGAVFRGAQADFSDIVNVSDVAAGNRISVQNGKIRILAANDIENSGTIAADGATGLNANDIEIRAAHDVNLNAGSRISASGRGAQSSGGNVLVWADNQLATRSGSSVRADGGEISGNGGYIDLSARGTLVLGGGALSAIAPHGVAGSILLDPENLDVAADLLRGDSDASSGGAGTDGITWNAGKLTLTADDTITVESGVVISTRRVTPAGGQSAHDAHINNASIGDSGDLELDARYVVLNSGAQLLANATGSFNAGNITINASDTATNVFFKALDGQDAGIEIHGATLKGRNIGLNANADDVYEYTGSEVANVILEHLDNFAYVADVSISRAKAHVLIDQNATIIASGDVDISAKANTEASMHVVSPNAIGFGYGEASASAIANVQSATVTAGGHVKVTADSTAKTDVDVGTSNSAETNPLVPGSSKYIDLALAMSQGNLTSSATIGAGAVVTSNNGVSVQAKGTKSANSTAEGMAYDDGTAGVALAFSWFDSNVTAGVDGKVNTTGKVSITANLETDGANTVVAKSGSGTGTIGGVTKFFDPYEHLTDAVSAIQGKIMDAIGIKSSSPTFGQKFGLAASFAYLDQTNTVEARIGNNAQVSAAGNVTTPGSIEVLAASEDLLTYKTRSSVDKAVLDQDGAATKQAKKAALSAAIAVVNLENDTKAYIGDGAVVDSAGAITVSAHSDVPVPYSAWGNWSDVTSFSAGAEKVFDLLGAGEFSLVTGWSQASAESDKLGLSGSFNFFTLGNTSNAWIGDGARINTNNLSTVAQDVTVSALSTQGTINISGVFGFKFFGGSTNSGLGLGLSYLQNEFDDAAHASIGSGAVVNAQSLSVNARSETDNISISEAGGKAGSGTAINGSIAYVDVNNSTTAKIDSSATLQVYGNLDVDASDETRNVTVAGGFSMGSNAVGVAVAVSDITRDTFAGFVDTGALANFSLAGVTVGANGMITLASGSAPVDGQSLVYTKGSGSGIAGLDDGATYYVIVPNPANPNVIQLARSAADSRAGTGSAITTISGTGLTNAAINAAGIVSSRGAIGVHADSGGILDSVAVAGSYASDAPAPAASKGQSAGDRMSQLSALDKQQRGRMGVAFSGDASVNTVNDRTEAGVSGARIVQEVPSSAVSLDVSAVNDSSILAIAGAVAVSTAKGTVPGIAGSYSENDIGDTTRAFVHGSQVQMDGDLSVAAKSSGEIEAWTVGVAVSTSADGVAGSVSINSIKNTVTTAFIDGQSNISSGSVAVTAESAASIFGLAGSLDFGGGKGAGFGASIAINDIGADGVTGNATNSTDAHIAQSDVTATSGGITVSEKADQDIRAVAVSAGASGDKMAVNLSVGVNMIKTTQTAYVSGKVSQGLNASGDVSVSAADDSSILAIGGGVAVTGGGAGVGGSGAYSQIDNAVSAYMADTKAVSTAGNVNVSATTSNEIETIGIGFAGGKTVGLAGSVAVNRVDTTTDAYLSNADVTANGSVAVVADADYDFTTYAGSLGIGVNKLGFGGTVAVNLLYGDTHAYITGGSLVDAAGLGSITVPTYNDTSTVSRQATGVAVVARTTQASETWGIAGGLSKDVGIGLTGSGTEATGETLAYVNGGSKVNTRNTASTSANQGASVEAFTETGVTDYLGAIGVGLDAAGVGATVGIGLVGTTTKAYIDGAEVDSRGSLAVKTYSTESVTGVGIAIGAGIDVGIAGTVFVEKISGNNEAYIANANSIDVGGDLTVRAEDHVYLGKNGGDGIVGGAGAVSVGAVAIGAAVSAVTITNSTTAHITDSQTDAMGATKLQAVSSQEANSAVMGIALSEWAGVGGSVVVNNIATSTQAYVEESVGHTTQIDSGTTGATTAQTVEVSAQNTTTLDTKILAAGAAFVGVGASVDATSIRNTVAASIGDNTEVKAGGGVSASATSKRDVTTNVVAFGGGAIGAAGAVTVLSIGADMSASDVANTQSTVDGQVSGTHDLIGMPGSASDFSLNAMFQPSVAPGSTKATIGSHATVTSGGDIKVQATDTIKVDALDGSAVAALGGLGASVALVTLKPGVEASVGAGATLSATGGVNVHATANVTDTTVDAYAGGVGGIALIAGVATVDTDSAVTAYIGQGAKVSNATSVLVTAERNTGQEASAWGLSLAATGAIGASVATSTSQGTTSSFVDDGADLSAAGSLTVNASNGVLGSYGNSAKAVAGAGGGLVGASGAVAVANSTGDVIALTGTGVKLPSGDVIVSAGRESIQQADSFGVTAGGFLAIGVTIATAESSGHTHAELGADTVTAANRAGSLQVSAIGSDSNTATSVAGSGGVLSGNGAEANTTDSSSVFAGVGGDSTGTHKIHTGAATIQASHTSEYSGHADSVNAAVVGASGATVNNDLTSEADVHVLQGADIEASQGIYILAHNEFLSMLSGDSASGAAGGVLVGAAAISTTTINGTTNLLLDPSVRLSSGTDPVLNPGGIVLEASTLVSASDHITLTTGGAIAGAGTDSSITATTKNTVTLGAGDDLESNGNFAAGAFTQAAISSISLVNTWGLAGVGIAHARTTLTNTDDVSVGDGTTIAGFGSVNLLAGDDPKGIYHGGISANAYAESYVRGLIALPYAYGDSDITSNASLEIGANARVHSAQNVTIGAYNGSISPTAYGAGHGYQLGFIPTDTGNKGNSSPQPVTTAAVSLGAGSEVVAGFYHDLTITIPDCAVGAVSCAVNAAAGGAPFTWSYTNAFSAPDFINSHFSGPGAALISSGTSSQLVGAVTLGTLFAAGGTVTVHADALSGSGTVTAYGGPTITVDNQSANYLVLGNVFIPNTPGGRVTFPGAASLATSQYSEINKDAPGAVSIHNAYAQAVGNSAFGPALFLTGDINNIGGSVDILNDKGSLGQAATIFGKSVTIKVPEGVAVIDLPDPQAYYAGGNPYSEWQNAILWPGGNPYLPGSVSDPNAAFASMFGPQATSFGRPGATDVHYFTYGNCTGGDCFGTQVPQMTTLSQSLSYASADLSGSRNSSAIYGGKVLIKATYIDINGGITIGANTDWSVNLSASLMNPVITSIFGQPIGGGEIAVADYKYAHNLASNPIFDLNTVTASNGTSLIGVKYDAQNKRILLDNVRASSDGGSLVLDGGILSTNTLGNIHVNGGLGDVVVNNQTGRALSVQDIYAGNAGPTQTVLSTVDITDHFYNSASNHWVYQYTPQAGVSLYNGAAGSSIDAGTMTQVAANNAYQPLQGLRWVWQEVATAHNALPTMSNPAQNAIDAWGNVLQCCDMSWIMPPSPATSPWQYVTSSGPSTTPAGHTIVDPGGPAFKSTITAQITETYPFVQAGDSQNFFWRGTEFDTGTKTLFFPKTVKYTLDASVKADNAIGIQFSGSAVGNVAINSNAPVVLGGTITNPGGTTTINSGALAQSAGATIQTNELIISATAGIGNDQQRIVARMSADGAITALGGAEGVYLDLQGGRIAAVASKNAAGTVFGNVNIKSLDDLLPVAGGSGAIVGANVTLSSTLGSVGTASAPIRLSAMGIDGTGGTVDVTALHDIALTDSAAHNFLVGRIASIADGDVSISVPNGSILNASGQTSADALGKDQVRKVWQDLHLTSQYGAEQEGSRTAHSVVAFENLADRYYQDYYALVAAGDTSSQRYQDTVTWLNTNVGGAWLTPHANPNFHYVATDSQVADLTKNAVWTEAELSNSIKQAALQPGSGAPVGVGQSNIVAHNVKLQAGGSIGKLADPIDVPLADIVAGTLTPEQSAALTLARTAGDIVSLGKDAQGNIVTYELATLPDGSVDYTSVPAGVTAYGFRIAQTTPLFVEMTGSINAAAGNAAFVQSVKPTLVVDRVQAGGTVGLIAPDSIIAAMTRTDPNLPLISAGDDLRLTVGTGSLGASGNSLSMQVGGKLQASAAQNVYLSSVGDLAIESLFTGNQLALTSTGGVFSGASGVVINAHGVNLQAGGDIGSSQTPLEMQIADNDSFSGSAGGSAFIRGAGTLHVGSLTSGGAAGISASGAILSAAGFSGVNVTGTDITLVSDTSDVGAVTKYLVIADSGKTSAEAYGNVYIEQRGGSFVSDQLTAHNGSIGLLVASGDATIGKITARDAVNVSLTSSGKLLIDNLDPASANLAVSGAGGSIEVMEAQIANSLGASASSVIFDHVTQVGGSGPLHMTMQGAGGGMANDVTANITSANGVTIDRLSARNALIDAQVANLWIESASIGGQGIFSNQSYTAYVDNVGHVWHDVDLQLYAPYTFYLRFFADPKFETNALTIDYRDNVTVNGAGPENAVTRFVPRMLAMLGLRRDKAAEDDEVPEEGLVTYSTEALIPADAIISIEQLDVNGR